MRLPATTRLLTLLLAGWFASVSCLLGCERDALAGLTGEHPSSDMHAMAAGAERALPQDCCEEERSGDSAPTRSGLMECCYQAPTISVGKAKPPRLERAGALAVVGLVAPIRLTESQPAAPVFLADSSGAYLLHRVLRI